MVKDFKKLMVHLEELRKKHRTLDNKINELYTHHITEELRRLKTEKLWLKDEIYNKHNFITYFHLSHWCQSCRHTIRSSWPSHTALQSHLDSCHPILAWSPIF